MFGAFAGLIPVTFSISILPGFLAMALGSLLVSPWNIWLTGPYAAEQAGSLDQCHRGFNIFIKPGPADHGAKPYNFNNPFAPRLTRLLFIISMVEIIVLLSSLLLMIGLNFFVQKTKTGKAMRATAQDKDTASLMGIDINKIVTVTFAIGSALGAAAGVMVGIYFRTVTPTMGLMPGLKGFVAAVLGGIGNIPGAMLGGILLGIAEVMGAAYISSQYRDAVAFALLIIILLFKPAGLLGRPSQEKV